MIRHTLAALALTAAATLTLAAPAEARPMRPDQVGYPCQPVYVAKYHEVICLSHHARMHLRTYWWRY